MLKQRSRSTRPKGISRGRATTNDAAYYKKTDPLIAEFRRRGFKPKEVAEIIKEMRLEYCSAEQEAKLFPDKPQRRAGFKIPYFGLDGKPMPWIHKETGEKHEGFFRFRYLDPPAGFKALTTKVQWYRQPQGSATMPYFPPIVPWKELLENPALPLLATEGEIKAAVAARNTIAAFAVGGVWNFKSSKAGVLLLPQLEPLAPGREITICYDSDTATNLLVLGARDVLARELIYAGATPLLATMPNLEGNEKTGLDDYIVAKGPEVFRSEVLNKAEHAAKEIVELNAEVRYVRTPPSGLMIRVMDRITMSVDQFLKHAYRNRVIVQRNTRGETVRKPLPTAWLESPLRAEVEGITYRPDGALINERGEFNIWPGWGCEPKKGNVEPFKKLFNRLAVTLSKEQKRWWLQRIAHAVQHPNKKIPSAVIVWGPQGNGKSMLGLMLGSIYGKNFKKIDEKLLTGSYNDWAENAGFVMGEELTTGDKRKHAETLKLIVSQEKVTIHKKYLPAYEIPDFVNLYLVSNFCDPVYMTDDDRRFFVVHCPKGLLSKTEREEFAEWKDSDDGPPALLYYLLKFPTTGFDPYEKPPVTSAKEEMIVVGRSAIEGWVFKLKEGPQQALRSKASLWTAEGLLRIYDPEGRKGVTEGTLGRKLGEAGFTQWGARGESKPMPVKALGTRLWIITSESAEVARLNGLGEKQIYAIYQEQHTLKHTQRGPQQ
jgi:hypothetical protein